MVHYGASKAGVVSITRTAAQVLAAYRITVELICPVVVDTPMWRQIDAEWTKLEGWEIGREAWKRRTSLHPLGRPETPEDVAGVVTFLASRDSDYMTGQAVNVDGGLVMGNLNSHEAGMPAPRSPAFDTSALHDLASIPIP